MATTAPEGYSDAYLPMPLVGPRIPGPLPVDPLPGEMGLTSGGDPEALLPALPDAPLPGQSILAWLPAAGFAAPDVVGGQPALPVLELFVVLLPLEDAGEFGSTGLPVPQVRELMPDVDGVPDCAYETPVAASKASSSAVEVSGFMIPPRECKADMVQGACRRLRRHEKSIQAGSLRCNLGGIVARHFAAGSWVRYRIRCRTVVGGATDFRSLASSVRGRDRRREDENQRRVSAIQVSRKSKHDRLLRLNQI